MNPLHPMQGGRQFALTEERGGLYTLFDQGQAAIVTKVGLLEPKVTLVEYEADVPWSPKRLFSHNDQQATWMSDEPKGASGCSTLS